jgi:hypothetical protein
MRKKVAVFAEKIPDFFLQAVKLQWIWRDMVDFIGAGIQWPYLAYTCCPELSRPI